MSRASILRLGGIDLSVHPGRAVPAVGRGRLRRAASQQTIDFFVRARPARSRRNDGRVLERGAGPGRRGVPLRAIARSLLPGVRALLHRDRRCWPRTGRTRSRAGELETLCTLTAQRLRLLHELDRAGVLRQGAVPRLHPEAARARVVWTDDAGKLDFDRGLDDVVRDARVILVARTAPLDPENHRRRQRTRAGGERASGKRRRGRSTRTAAPAGQRQRRAARTPRGYRAAPAHARAGDRAIRNRAGARSPDDRADR